MGFEGIKGIIDKIKKGSPGLEERLEEAQAFEIWGKTVGEQIAKHTTVLKVEDHVLHVQVDHPVWKSELHHRKSQILASLNSAIQKENAKLVDIFFEDPKKKKKPFFKK